MARSSSSACNRLKTLSLPALLKRGFIPALNSVNSFLLYLSQNKRFNFVVHFFSQMSSNQMKANSETHSIFLWALLNLHKFQEARQYINTQVTKTSFSPQSRLFDSLIQGFCIKRNEPEMALLVLKDCLRNHGVLPSSFTFCSLIYSFCSLGKMNRAVEVLEFMSDENVKYPFDNFVCSSVVSGFCKIGKPDLAIGFFENAVSLGALKPNVVSYTALVSALCMLGRFIEVNELFSRMEDEGFKFDVVFYSSWICGYTREGMLLEAFSKHMHMVDKGIKPDTVSYSILVDAFSKEGNVEKAVGILNKMIKDGLKPNLITYTAIIFGFCKKGKLEEAFTVFKKVEELGLVADEFIYATLIGGVCRVGDIDCAFSLLEDMEKKEIRPSIITYNTIINGLCKVGRTSDADEISKGVLGDVVTYSTLLHGYIEEDNVKGILETKQRLEEAGLQIDVVMCNILIKALFMVGALEDARALYQAMPELNLVANSVTYSTMINGYCKVGRIEEALEIFDEFRRMSISSVACYNCIINGLCNRGMVDMATEVFIELNEKCLGLHDCMYKILLKEIFARGGVDAVLNFMYKVENLRSEIYDIVCNYVIHFLCKRGLSEVAGVVYMSMRKRGSVVTSQSYHSILKALINNGKKWPVGPILTIFVKENGLVEPMVREIVVQYLCLNDVTNALRFINKMKENSTTINVPFNILEKLMKDGRVLDAYKIFMGAEDMLPCMDIVNYSTLVAALCRLGYVSKGLDLCAFARNKGITLNIVIYNTVIHSLCRQGSLVEAFRLFDSLERINISPSEVTFATLIDSLCKEGQLLDARQLLKRMVLKGLKPNTRIYNSFINGYCKFGQMEEAFNVLHDVEVNCLDPDGFTISAMINGFCQKGDMEGALRFFFEFNAKGLSPDFLGFLYLVKGLCTKGRMEEARNILREMLQSKSVLELINRVDIEVESESVLNFLFSLCEQGSISEAVTVLDEVGYMFFPVQRFENDRALGRNKLDDCKSLNAVASVAKFSNEQSDLEMVEDSYTVGKTSQVDNFDFCYSRVASFCSKGELQKANNLMKEMLSSFKEDS